MSRLGTIRAGNPIGRGMKKALAFIAEHPGCMAREVIRHLYPQSGSGRSAQSGRALVDRLLMGGLVWHVKAVEGYEPSTLRRLYPLAVCKVHDDCVAGGLEIQMACAKANPVTGWSKTLPHVPEAVREEAYLETLFNLMTGEEVRVWSNGSNGPMPFMSVDPPLALSPGDTLTQKVTITLN